MMPQPQVTFSKDEPSWEKSYQFVGFFATKAETVNWVKAAYRAGHDYPCWIQEKPGLKVIGMKYVLWRYKPRKGKMVGKGFR